MLLSLLSKRAFEVESRDGYGFAFRPQHIQGYNNYTCIYKEEEDERSDKWKCFLEQQLKSAQPSSPEEICKETSHTEATTQKEDSVADRSKEDDDTSCSNFDSSSSAEKELQPTKKSETRKVQTWIQIKPSLGAVDHMMSLRVKMRKNMIDKEKNAGSDHLSSIKEDEPLGVVHEENFEDRANEVSDDTKKHSMGSDEDNGISSEPFFPWEEELGCLVSGGVPKELRGEV